MIFLGIETCNNFGHVLFLKKFLELNWNCGLNGSLSVLFKELPLAKFFSVGNDPNAKPENLRIPPLFAEGEFGGGGRRSGFSGCLLR